MSYQYAIILFCTTLTTLQHILRIFRFISRSTSLLATNRSSLFPFTLFLFLPTTYYQHRPKTNVSHSFLVPHGLLAPS